MAEHASQLSLFPSDAPSRVRTPRPEALKAQADLLARRLSTILGMDVRLAITDNRSRVVSYRRREDALVLRVHHVFLGAPEKVVRALAAFAGEGRRDAGKVIDHYVRAHQRAIQPPRVQVPLRSRGLFHDLQSIFDRLNAEHFGGAIEAKIGWGRLTARRGRRSIRMGVYLHGERLIRIHPALDRPEVPAFFVAFIVFHEMLHQAVPADQCGNRKQHHSPAFRALERAYPDTARALAWEQAHLDLLLGREAARPTG